MYGFYQDGTYSMKRLWTNRLLIMVPSAAVLALVVLLVSIGRYSTGNAVGMAALVFFFAGSMWWAIGTKTAGPARVSPRTIAYFKQVFTRR